MQTAEPPPDACATCGHGRRSHKWAFTNKYGTVYRYRRCRACLAERRRGRRAATNDCTFYVAAPRKKDDA